MAQQLYTPFLAQAGKTLGQGLQKKAEQELIQSAYMGDSQALAKLSSVNPQAANQIRSERTSKAQSALQTKRRDEDVKFRQEGRTYSQAQDVKEEGIAAKDRKQEAMAKVQEMKGDIQEKIANFTDFNQASEFYKKQVTENTELLAAAGIDPATIELTESDFGQIKKAMSGKVKADQVQSSLILPGGLTQIVYKSGKVEVKDADGESKTLVEAAEERGAELQGLRSSERTAGTGAQQMSIEAFKTSSQIRKSIDNLTEGIGYIEEGAETGAMDKLLPSVREASVKLDNLVGKMGLDVISSVTFGALSESELKFALSVAAPPNLQPKPLKEWFIKKRASQEKLLENLEEVAIYLGTPGNTIADFVKMKMKKEKEDKDKGDDAGDDKAKALPNGVTEDDIAATMAANKMTRQQVLDKLGAK